MSRLSLALVRQRHQSLPAVRVLPRPLSQLLLLFERLQQHRYQCLSAVVPARQVLTLVQLYRQRLHLQLCTRRPPVCRHQTTMHH